MGTPAFVSPEQAEGKHVDARSDIFSFGAVLFQMATGKRAFTGTSMTAVMGAAILRAGRQIRAAFSLETRIRAINLPS